MRGFAATVVLIAGCNFEKQVALPPPCPDDPALQLCLRFDQDPLPATVPNEGAVPLDVSLTNVTTSRGLEGEAAQLDATSVILVPPTPAIAAVKTLEIWVHLASQPAAGARMGLIDNAVGPGLSLFYYNANEPPDSTTGPARSYLRCVYGDLGTTIYGDVTLDTDPSSWSAIACVCNDDGSLLLYLDGAVIASTPTGCNAGSLVQEGTTVGQDNRSAGVVGDPWLGAIDGVRLWSSVRTEAQLEAPGWD